jgi:hypothetical protein
MKANGRPVKVAAPLAALENHDFFFAMSHAPFRKITMMKKRAAPQRH